MVVRSNTGWISSTGTCARKARSNSISFSTALMPISGLEPWASAPIALMRSHKAPFSHRPISSLEGSATTRARIFFSQPLPAKASAPVPLASSSAVKHSHRSWAKGLPAFQQVQRRLDHAHQPAFHIGGTPGRRSGPLSAGPPAGHSSKATGRRRIRYPNGP